LLEGEARSSVYTETLVPVGAVDPLIDTPMPVDAWLEAA
jgi:hypothetical protein